MIWYIVQVKEPALGVVNNNVQVLLAEDSKNPISFFSPESAYAWAESVGFLIDNLHTFVIDRDTQEVA